MARPADQIIREQIGGLIMQLAVMESKLEDAYAEIAKLKGEPEKVNGNDK